MATDLFTDKPHFTVDVDAEQVINTQVTLYGERLKRLAVPLHVSAGDLQVSADGATNWQTVALDPTGSVSLGQLFPFVRTTSAATITFFAL